MAESVLGRIELPLELFVQTGVLGQRFSARSAVAEFTLTFPLSPELPIEPEIFMPALRSPWLPDGAPIDRNDHEWGVLNEYGDGGVWKNGDAKYPTADVSALGFTASWTDTSGATERDITRDFGDAFDAWFRRVVDWLQLWPSQRLTN